jgi:quinol monooxygenase YgiN
MTATTNEIHGTARLVIRDGKLEEFKRLVAQAMEVVRTKDPGTIEYNVYLNAEGTEAFAHERYRDSAAGMAHSAPRAAEGARGRWREDLHAAAGALALTAPGQRLRQSTRGRT